MKNLCLITAILLLSTLFPMASTAETYTELMPNGSFEILKNGEPSGWYASGGWGGENVTLDSTKARTGNYSAKITANTITNPYVSYVISVSANTRYRISAYIITELTGNNPAIGAAFKLEFYKGTTCTAENYLDEANSTHYTGNTNDVWTQLVMYATTPAECTLIKVCARLYTTGTVWYDDVSVFRDADVDTFTLKTSHCVHYTDDNEPGKVSVFIDNVTDSSKDGLYKADFKVYADNSTLVESLNTPFKLGKSEFTYNPSVMNKETLYSIGISVKDTNGSVVYEKTRRLMLFDRPSRLDKDGNYIIKGKKINPVFGYHVNVEDFPKVKEAGINVVQISWGYSSIVGNPTNVQYVLDQLEKYDLYGIFCLYMDMKFAADPANINNTRLITKILKDYDRVFAWKPMDEPCGSGVTEEKLELLAQSYYEIRKNDPNHPVFFCDYTIDYYEEEIKYTDIFCPNIYTRSETRVKYQTEEAIKVAKGKPVYAMVRTYGDSDKTLPAKDEIPHYVYQAFFAGAKGIGFYSISDALYHTSSNPMPIYTTDRWETMTRLKEEYPLLFDLFGSGVPYTDTEGRGYILREWNNGCKFYLSQGEGQYIIDLGENQSQFLAGNENLLLKDGNILKISAPSWRAVLFRPIDKSQKIVFAQKGFVINTAAPGNILVSGTIKGSILFVTLVSDGKVVDIKTCQSEAYPTVEIKIPNDGKGYNLQGFLWDGSGLMKPLAKKAEISN